MSDYIWAASNGAWSDPSNWTVASNSGTLGSGAPNGEVQSSVAPTPQDTATFESAQPATVTGAAYIGNVLLDGANVTLDGNFSAQSGQGTLSDSTGSSATSSTLTIGTWAELSVEAVQLTNTDLVVDGAVSIDHGSLVDATVAGGEAALEIASNLSINNLSVTQGSVVSGNLSLDNGGSLTVDDQSTVSGGTITASNSGALNFISTVGGANETVDVTDVISLNNSDLTINADPGILVSLDGAVSGSGELTSTSDNVAVNGTLTASGGSLVLGSTQGTGTLAISSNSNLILSGEVGAGLNIIFGDHSTLTVTGQLPKASISHFSASDEILLPSSQATAVSYTATKPGSGTLIVTAANGTSAELSLLGNESGLTFSVSAAGSQSVISVSPSTVGVAGGETVSGSYGSTTTSAGLISSLGPISAEAQSNIGTLLGTKPVYVWFEAGDTTVVGSSNLATGAGNNVQVLGPIAGNGSAITPGSNVILAPGYDALIAEGSENINLFDEQNGNSIIVGNSGRDTLVTFCSGDTLIGGSGANTVFWAGTKAGDQSADKNKSVVVYGGGNDTISTNTDNAHITTSQETSQVCLGASNNTVLSNGHDMIVGADQSSDLSRDSIIGQSGSIDTVFGPQFGSLSYAGQSAVATLVGGGGTITMTAGSKDGNVLWAGNSAADYIGGSGTGIVVGGNQMLTVQGGAGALEVWAGTGGASIKGAAGASVFVVGEGASTVSAAAGNEVWVTGHAPVSIVGEAGCDVYAGQSSGNDIFQASAGSETLWGGAGNNDFIAGSGNGTFVCAGGASVISFTNGMTGGSDDIVGFVPGQDVIDLNGYGSSLPTITVDNGSSYLALSDGTQIELYGVTSLSLSSIHQT